MGAQVLSPKYQIRRKDRIFILVLLLIFQSDRCGFWAARIPGGRRCVSFFARWQWLSWCKGWCSSFSSFPSSSCTVDCCHFSGPGKVSLPLGAAGRVSGLSLAEVGPAHCSGGAPAGRCPWAAPRPLLGTEPSSAWPSPGNWGRWHSWQRGDFVPPLPPLLQPPPGTCLPLQSSLEGGLLPSLTKLVCHRSHSSGFSFFQTFIKGHWGLGGWGAAAEGPASVVPEHSGDWWHHKQPLWLGHECGVGWVMVGLKSAQVWEKQEGHESWGNLSWSPSQLPCYLYKKSCPLGTGTACHLSSGALGSSTLLTPYLEQPQHDPGNSIPRAKKPHRFLRRRKSLLATFSLRVPLMLFSPLQTNLNTAFLVLISRDIFSALTHCGPLPAIIWEFHHS